ncbi:two-component regulator propeller domain-containing protein [Rhodocytophaga aerolata]|uniref:Two-component regulator propeller domain-containing protein n=1 Tax=Rhodocytophaga aerolata TaxID=455078 RepID=A0ABT8R338_9BACT|nr:sensor histidine kinase [Rhodocytophaga aerolata]MDO1446508.1 two-component regulator propeller domain-containing protein [Rhodocytophaga aerolata]
MVCLSWIKLFLICFLLLICSVTGFAQADTFTRIINFKHISLDKGLSNTSVYDIEQTNDGFLWIGTQNGLNRYDGYSIKVFNVVPGKPHTLSNNWVKALCEDKEGNLWVGTNNGLNKYHAETATFSSYYNDPAIAHSLADNTIWCLFKDRDGYLWIGTNKGLSRYDETTNQFNNYFIPSADATSSVAVDGITEDTQGNLWVGTWGKGVYLFNKRTGTFQSFAEATTIPQTTGEFVKALTFDSQGTLWIGTQQNGLHSYDPASKNYTIYTSDKTKPYSLSNNSVLSIMEDSSGDLWIGTHAGGLNYFNRTDHTFRHYQTDFLQTHSLQGQWVTSIFEDNGGNIWLGHDQGLSHFNPQGPKFAHFKNNPFKTNSVAKSNIGVMYETNDAMLWIGTWGAGLSRYDRVKNQFTHFRPQANTPGSIADKRVWGLCEDLDGNLWVATSNGLDRFNRQTSSFTHFNDLQKDNKAAQIPYTELTSVAVDNQNRLWIGTWGGGFYMHDQNKHTTQQFLHSEQDTNSLANDWIRHIFVDTRQNVWIATSDGGLDRLQMDKNGKATYTHLRYKANDLSTIGSDTPQIVFEDSKGRIWVGTQGGGLCLYNADKGNFQRIFLGESLTHSTSVYGILEDETNNLWISTNKGIIHYNTFTGRSKSYDVSDGLQGTSFLSGHCKARDGAMFFGGNNGFTMFYPVQIKESNFKPSVLLSDLHIFNERLEVGKPHKNTRKGQKPVLEKPLYLTDQINLTYKDYAFSIDFVALDFASPAKNRYAYILENFEEEWNYTNASKRYATYTNLRPGNYILKVKGTNSDGVWNEQVTFLKIVVSPPFWQTWWFRAIMLLLFGVLFFIIHRIWLRVKTENLLMMERVKVQEAEAIRKRVAMDFHDEMGNQLASITALINLITLRHGKKDFHIEDLLSKLSQHAQTLYYGTKDFIWSIDPQSDKVEVILLNIKDFGDELFDRTDIAFYFFKDLHDPALSFAGGNSRHITLICKEILTNIVKHAHCKTVHVVATSTEGLLSIAIKDNGCGYEPDKLKKKGNGLENMQARAKKINGSITVHSKPGLGTEVILQVSISPANHLQQQKNTYTLTN